MFVIVKSARYNQHLHMAYHHLYWSRVCGGFIFTNESVDNENPFSTFVISEIVETQGGYEYYNNILQLCHSSPHKHRKYKKYKLLSKKKKCQAQSIQNHINLYIKGRLVHDIQDFCFPFLLLLNLNFYSSKV